MAVKYVNMGCCYEGCATRWASIICVLTPLTILALAYVGWLHAPEIKLMPENKVTVLQIMPMPLPPEPLPLIEEFSPQVIEPSDPLPAPEPKPKPVEKPKPQPSPKPTPNPVEETPPVPPQPVTESFGGAPKVSPEPVKSAAPPTPPQMAQGDYDKFLSAFLYKVKQELYYPKAAQRGNLSGTVKVGIVFDAGGQIVSYKLADSGNCHKLLGEAALKTIEQVKAGWKPPLAPGHQQTIVVPVVFELK